MGAIIYINNINIYNSQGNKHMIELHDSHIIIQVKGYILVGMRDYALFIHFDTSI